VTPVTPVARLVLVAGSASLLDSAAIISVGSALPLWRNHLALSVVEVGVISATLTIAIAVGALTGGVLADRLGRSRVFAVTVGVYAAGAAMVGVADSRDALVVGVAVLGLGSGADLPASIALVAERAPTQLLARAVAATHVLWTVGIVLASAAALAASPFGVAGMRVVFLCLGAAAVVTLVARVRVLPVAVATTPALALSRDERRTGEARRALVAIAVFYGLYTLVANTFGSFRTYLLVTTGGTSQQVATAIAFAATLVGLVGTVVFSVIAGSSWRRRIYPVAGAGLVLSQAVLALTVGRSLLLTITALLLYALAYPYVGEGLYKVWAQESVSPGARASFQGVTIAGARAGAAVFALATPWLLEHRPAVLFWLLASVAAVTVLVGAPSRRGALSPSSSAEPRARG
jgi:inositol transporter-like SP family MFS transporter